MHVRKKNGDVYEPTSLKDFQRSLQRYLNDKSSQVNILQDQELKSLDSYKSALTAHQQKMSLVLSRSTPLSCATGSKRLQPLETNQTNEAFNNNVQQNLSYSSSSAVEGMFSGATIQKIEGCNFNFYFKASKSPIRGANLAKKRRVILSDDSESD